MKIPMALMATSAMLMTCDVDDARAAEKVPLTMTITCSDKVSPGTLILSNPPKANCKDLKMMGKFVGTGFKIGPFKSHQKVVESINKMLVRIEHRGKTLTNDKVASVPQNNGSWTNINQLPGMGRVEAWKAGVKSHDLDDFGDKRSAAFREIEERNSSPCKGHVNLNDILSGKCGNVKIKVKD